MPGDSWLPVLLSVAMFVMFGGMLLMSEWVGGAGLLAALVVLGIWFRPHPATEQDEEVRVYG